MSKAVLETWECESQRIILKPITPDDEVTPGGIHKPDRFRERPTEGVIRFVSPEETFYKVGDIVKFNKYAGSAMEVAGEDLLIMHRSNVFARKQVS